MVSVSSQIFIIPLFSTKSKIISLPNENKIKDIALKQQKYFIITSITKLITEQSLVCNIFKGH